MSIFKPIRRKTYVLGDFTQHGTTNFSKQFSLIADTDLYTFAEKTYIDDKSKPRRYHMLLVGHYMWKSGGPPVWAHATGERIHYFSGSNFQVTPLIRDAHTSRVYYDPPFSLIGGGATAAAEPRSGMTSERLFERTVVEAAINFVFLSTGRLENVLDLVNPDLLGNFKTACKNYMRISKASNRNRSAQLEQDLESQAVLLVRGKRKRVDGPGTSEELVQRKEKANSSKLTVVDLTGDGSDEGLKISRKRAQQLEQNTNREAEMTAKLQLKIRELEAKLEKQTAKTNATDERLMREKTKRRAAQVQRQAWKDKYIKQRDMPTAASPELPKNHVKEENQVEEPDWNTMFFEKERQAEHYKVRYISLKDEKKALEAQIAKLHLSKQELKSKVDGQKSALTGYEVRYLRLKASEAEKQNANGRLCKALEKEKEARQFWQKSHRIMVDCLDNEKKRNTRTITVAATQDQRVPSELALTPNPPSERSHQNKLKDKRSKELVRHGRRR